MPTTSVPCRPLSACPASSHQATSFVRRHEQWRSAGWQPTRRHPRNQTRPARSGFVSKAGPGKAGPLDSRDLIVGLPNNDQEEQPCVSDVGAQASHQEMPPARKGRHAKPSREDPRHGAVCSPQQADRQAAAPSYSTSRTQPRPCRTASGSLHQPRRPRASATTPSASISPNGGSAKWSSSAVTRTSWAHFSGGPDTTSTTTRPSATHRWPTASNTSRLSCPMVSSGATPSTTSHGASTESADDGGRFRPAEPAGTREPTKPRRPGR